MNDHETSNGPHVAQAQPFHRRLDGGPTEPPPLAQAQGQLARDLALLENAQSDLKKLEDAGAAVSKQEVDTARALVKQYTGAIKSDEGTIATANLQLTYSRVVSPITGRIGLR